MKKLLLAAVGLGLVVVSCGTKESSMSSSTTDSTATVTTKMVTPVATDSSKMAVTDSLGVDSVAAPRPAK